MQPTNSLSFNQKHSLAIRIWHWATFITMSASLICVLLASTLFRTRNNISMVQEQLQGKGATVTQDQARAVAHEYSDKLWEWHTFMGYALCFLLLSRLVIEFLQPSDEKLSVKIKAALGFVPVSNEDKKEKNHYLMVKRGYLFFYTILLVMGLTGLVLAFEDAPMLKSIHGAAKSIHEFTQYLIYFFILFHLIGVIRTDSGKNKGLVSGMINGNK